MNFFLIIAISAFVILIPLNIWVFIVLTEIQWGAGDKLLPGWGGHVGLKELKKYRETVTDKEELRRLERGITLLNLIKLVFCCFVLGAIAAAFWPTPK